MSVMISLLLLMTLAKRFQLCSIFFNREVSFKGLLTPETKKRGIGWADDNLTLYCVDYSK